jgi:c-di-GMP-binding flagellar brake protein YcgR
MASFVQESGRLPRDIPKMDSATVQRRRYARHEFEAPVFLRSAGSHAREGWRGHCLNLSEAGAGVMVPGPWRPGQVVQLEIALPAREQPLLLVARLVHGNRLYWGLEFLGMSESLRRTLPVP